MRKIKIVADSSSNVFARHGVDFASAPLKIITDDAEFVDDANLDVDAMVSYFDTYKGKSKTSCPNPGDWLEAFADAQEVFCITITSNLSGSYNSACVAKQMYEDEYPDRKVFVIDSLSAGPELLLIVEKLEQLITEGMAFDEICSQIKEYQQTIGLEFMLQSLKNLAANGRVSPAVAKIATLLGIRIVGKASDVGTLEPTDKCPGQGRALHAVVKNMAAMGLNTGKVRIAHCAAEPAANALKVLLAEKLPQTQVEISQCTGLCSYYAEKGGLMIGFEKF